MQSKTGKKRVTVMLSVALVVVLGIGFTLALLSQRTEDVVNNFTVLGGLDVSLDEEWDPEDGEGIVPDNPVVKEPYMVNESESTTVYVAMQLYLLKGNATDADAVSAQNILSGTDYQRLLGLVEIQDDLDNPAPDFNDDTGKWRKISTPNIGDVDGNGTIFMYDTVLKTEADYPDNETETLFKKVTISADATSEDLEWIKGLGGFDIFLRGAAVQADALDKNDPNDLQVAEDALLALFAADPIQ